MCDKDEREKLKEIKPGDYVAKGIRVYDNIYHIAIKVNEVTKTQIIFVSSNGYKYRYRKDNGDFMSSDKWNDTPSIMFITPKIQKKIEEDNKKLIIIKRRRKAIDIISNADLQNVPLENLEKAASYLEIEK